MLIKTGKPEATQQDPRDCIKMQNFYAGEKKEECTGKMFAPHIALKGLITTVKKKTEIPPKSGKDHGFQL